MRAVSQFFFLFIVFLATSTFGKDPSLGHVFIANEGQWHQDILFKTSIEGGVMLITKQGFEYHFGNVPAHFSADINAKKTIPDRVKVGFGEDTRLETFTAEEQTKATYNFFIGNNPNKWKRGVRAYRDITFQNLRPGQDLRVFSMGGTIKYEIVVKPGSKADNIYLELGSAHNFMLSDNALQIKTAGGLIKEYPPFTYQDIAGTKLKVPSSYELKNGKVFFKVGDYDKSKKLVIDPELVFSSYSGSTSDNWAQSATYDAKGNLYAGGVVFGGIFPITANAYQAEVGGAASSSELGLVTDVVIQKFSSDGKELVYSTYLGGASSEVPHSLICNSKDELVIFGTSSSDNYPTTGEAYQRNFKGGTELGRPTITTGIRFPFGTDMFLSVLSEDGSELKGSTYLGGSETDGIHRNAELQIKNYGDEFRGEVYVDTEDRVYIASTTNSVDFPLVKGESFGRSNDGIAARLSPYLRDLEWSTYISGRFYDAAYGIRVDSDGNVYVVGSSRSSDLGATQGALNEMRQGAVDAFVVKYSNDKKVALTYLGTEEEDLGMFIDLDSQGHIYIFGLSLGSYPVSSGAYRIEGSGQFIQCLENDLSHSVFSSVFGTGRGRGYIDLVPTAFLVNNCGNLYIAGWGGKINEENGFNQNSTTTGLPVSNDAYRKETTGNNFYFAILEAEARSFLYGTFFGSDDAPDPDLSRGDHLDGGTCRFDKNGVIYHTACVCRAQDEAQTVIFPTQNAVYDQHRSDNCNMAAFKFDVSGIKADFDIIEGEKINPEYVCASSLVDLKNKSKGALTYEWSIDGKPITRLKDFDFRFLEEKKYTIGLKAFNQVNCGATDSVFRQVNVRPFPVTVSKDTTICASTSATLRATGGESYSWSPASMVDRPSESLVVTHIDETTTFEVTISDSICSVTQAVEVQISEEKDDFRLSKDREVCRGQVVELEALGKAISYVWRSEDMQDKEGEKITVSPLKTSTYEVQAVYEDGCKPVKNVTLRVDESFSPKFEIDYDYECGKPMLVRFKLEDNEIVNEYTWFFGNGDSLVTRAAPQYMYEGSGVYEVKVRARNSLGCSLEEKQLVEIPDNDGFIPNAISPNGDGKNERFVIGTPKSALKIFNRWGKLLFSENNYKNNWGENVPPDVYFYEVTLPNQKLCKGWVEVFN